MDVHATHINEDMKVATVHAKASLVSKDELNAEYVIPRPFDPKVAPSVAKAAMETGVARQQVDPEEMAKKTRQLSLIDED
ncbi:hypothetical protein GCM10007096_35140 [Pullulanibacillus pueri]|uniref:Uncharacterized protein n=1 Tax=Pullulanibacillus pueri TaxID=1437324 RepID=A0A8J3EN43_9BACL|nr:hypothetical protein GCM10007096_35140 [Pullulanibacillus pueri]